MNEKQIFETSKKDIEEIIIDSDAEESVKSTEDVKSRPRAASPVPRAVKPKARRGRPRGPITDPAQLEKLKHNLKKGREKSLKTRQRNAVLKAIEEEEANGSLDEKQKYENEKIQRYMESKIIEPITPPQPPKRINSMFKPVIF